MLTLAALVLLLAAPASAAAPLLDGTLHAFSGAGGGTGIEMPLNLAGRVGGAAMVWPVGSVGIGLRVDGGSYGLLTRDTSNAFAFAESQVKLADRWTAGLGVGLPVAWIEYSCQGSCERGVWEEHHPIGALTGTLHLEEGVLHVPISARAEVGADRWAVGIDVGFGFRIHRKS